MKIEIHIPGKEDQIIKVDTYEDAIEKFEEALWDAKILAENECLSASDLGLVKNLETVLEEQGFLAYGHEKDRPYVSIEEE